MKRKRGDGDGHESQEGDEKQSEGKKEEENDEGAEDVDMENA